MLARCAHCARPGQPYVYKGLRFDGLHAAYGERLCSPCLERVATAYGVAVQARNPHNGDTLIFNTRDMVGWVVTGGRWR